MYVPGIPRGYHEGYSKGKTLPKNPNQYNHDLLKNSASLDNQAASKARRVFLTALAVSQRGATSTRTMIESKRRARGKQAGRPTPQAHPRDGNDRYKCQQNKKQETDKL